MSKILEQYLENNIPGLTKEEISLICLKAAFKKLRKKQLLLEEGEICRHKVFVIKGLLRNYSMHHNGNEYVMKFTAENGWTTDPDSYNNRVPSAYNIEALEPSEIIMWTRDNFDELKSAIPLLATFSERIITANMSLVQNRILLNISASAEKRYLDFIETFPHIFHRVPLHMIASYLGVSRETLTRIRQGLTVSKL